MRERLLASLVIFLATTSAAAACPCSDFAGNEAAKPRPDVGFEAGLTFTKTGEYRKQFDLAIADARKACEEHMGEPRVAIVSDLDETLLDNRELISRNKNDKDILPHLPEWVNEARAPLLKPTADFLAWARKNGYAIFFVTGRQENLRAGTITNLIRNHVQYDGLYMRAVGDKRSAVDVKKKFREDIENMGFKIVVNIGDQPTDLLGGHALDCELLPNQMYAVP
jgi:acid phosphatase